MRILSAFGFTGFDTEIKMGLEAIDSKYQIDILQDFDLENFLSCLKKYDLIILRESFCCNKKDIISLCDSLMSIKAVIVLDCSVEDSSVKVKALNRMGFTEIITENITVTKIIDMIRSININNREQDKQRVEINQSEGIEKPKAKLKTKKEPDSPLSSRPEVNDRIKSKPSEKEKKDTTRIVTSKLERKLKYFNPDELPRNKEVEPKNKSTVEKKKIEQSKQDNSHPTKPKEQKEEIKAPITKKNIEISSPELDRAPILPMEIEKNEVFKPKERLKLYMCAHDMQSQVALNMASSISTKSDVIYIELDERNKLLIDRVKESVKFKIIELYGQPIEASFEYFKSINSKTVLIVNGKFEEDKLYLCSLIDVFIEVTQNQYVIDKVKAGFDKYVKPNLLKFIVVAYFEDGLLALKKINSSLRQRSLKIYNTRQDEYNSRAESKLYIDWHAENIKEMIENIS